MLVCLVSENVSALVSPVSKYARDNHHVFVLFFLNFLCTFKCVRLQHGQTKKPIEREKKEKTQTAQPVPKQKATGERKTSKGRG